MADPHEFLPTQYSSPLESTPHPATDIMWLIWQQVMLIIKAFQKTLGFIQSWQLIIIIIIILCNYY